MNTKNRLYIYIYVIVNAKIQPQQNSNIFSWNSFMNSLSNFNVTLVDFTILCKQIRGVSPNLKRLIRGRSNNRQKFIFFNRNMGTQTPKMQQKKKRSHLPHHKGCRWHQHHIWVRQRWGSSSIFFQGLHNSGSVVYSTCRGRRHYIQYCETAIWNVTMKTVTP